MSNALAYKGNPEGIIGDTQTNRREPEQFRMRATKADNGLRCLQLKGFMVA